MKLGRSDLTVSRIVMGGAWGYGKKWGAFDEESAEAAVREARRLGITFFDTALGYGFGASERVMGRALREDLDARRDEVVIATKGGLGWDDEKGFVRDASPDALRRDLETSLTNLGVDHVDVYMVHWPDPGTPMEETARAMAAFVDEGLVRAVGVSNFSVEQMKEFQRTCKIDALQPPYHLFDRAIEEDVLPYCKAENIGVFTWGPLAHGLLAGKYTPDTTFPPGNWRSESPIFQGETYRQSLATVDRLKEIAARHDRTVKELAIAWTLQHPAVHATIVGARKPEQIRGTAPAAEFKLDDATLAEIADVMRDAPPYKGPEPESV